MRTEKLLRLIWQGDVWVSHDKETRAFARAFQDIVQVRAVTLRIGGGEEAPVVMSEDTELMPALPLGDVLAEELGLDVPYGTLVLMMPDAAPGMASQSLGRAVAETILFAVMHSDMPVQRQTDAIYVAAHGAMRMTLAPALLDAGFDRHGFGMGMAQALARFWRGNDAIFARPDFLWTSELTAHLKRLDPAFTAPDPTVLPPDLLHVSEGPTGLPLWVTRVESTLRRVLGAPQPEMSHGTGIMSRFNLQ
ncbi:hypothetical protein [Pseudooceanicola sp. LIPI14-2-Ac024]|uniref:hypothetical protein n=1 Tax=Pseudooceanicola sp. LIPI14-2-Ac024 TaxID=3344875 RepID=UPI0035CFC380